MRKLRKLFVVFSIAVLVSGCGTTGRDIGFNRDGDILSVLPEGGTIKVTARNADKQVRVEKAVTNVVRQTQLREREEVYHRKGLEAASQAGVVEPTTGKKVGDGTYPVVFINDFRGRHQYRTFQFRLVDDPEEVVHDLENVPPAGQAEAYLRANCIYRVEVINEYGNNSHLKGKDTFKVHQTPIKYGKYFGYFRVYPLRK